MSSEPRRPRALLKGALVFFGILIFIAILPHLLFSYRRYNVILITIDTLRADYVSCYNHVALPTPNLDAIAAKSVQFTNAYSLIPITLPSHTSIFSSHAPHEVSVFNNGDIVGKNTLLADEMVSAGFHTGAFVSLAVLKSDFGLAHGFQTYSDQFGKRWYRTADEINAVALPWIEKQKNSRFFAWIHYSDPHEPYIVPNAPPDTEVWVNGRSAMELCLAKKERTVVHFVARKGENIIEFRATQVSPHIVDRVSVKPEEDMEIQYGDGWNERPHGKAGKEQYFEDRAFVRVINHGKEPAKERLIFRGDIDQTLEEVRQNYAAEVRYADRYVGLLWKRLEDLGLLKKTIVIITADHGEGLGTHNRIGHLYPLYREVTQVPLLIYYPGLGRSGKKSHRLVNLLDIKPTILDLTHLSAQSPMEGESLRKYISWSPIDFLLTRTGDRVRTFFSTYAPQGKSNSFALIHDNIKLIETRDRQDWKWEAYDLKKDPGEFKDLAVFDVARFRDPAIAQFRPILQQYGEEAERAQKGHKNPELSEEQKKMLRDLGYVAP